MENQEIITKSVGAGVAKTTPIKLDFTPETRTNFYPTIHSKGICGSIVKFKKDKKSEWKNLHPYDFSSHTLNVNEKINIPISTEALNKLVEEITARKEIVEGGVKYGSHEYITIEKNKVVIIDDKNKKQLLEQILDKGYSDEFWKMITGSDPELANKLTAGHLQLQRKNTIEELRVRLTKKYPETRGSDSWQSWIFRNNWLFGSNYQNPIEKQKINITGIMPDYLFPTIDGFVDVLEIKLPADEVIEQDTNHPGSWVWTDETTKAIGQVVNYLGEIDRLRREIEAEIKKKYKKDICLLKPRAFILIGDSKDWDFEKREALRKLNHSLHGIEVITYFDLVQRGEAFLGSSFSEIVVG